MENTFLIRYDHYDWSLNLSLACSDAARVPPPRQITAPPSQLQQPQHRYEGGYEARRPVVSDYGVRGGGYAPAAAQHAPSGGYHSLHTTSANTQRVVAAAYGGGGGERTHGGDYDYRQGQPVRRDDYGGGGGYGGYEPRKDAGYRPAHSPPSYRSVSLALSLFVCALPGRVSMA